MPLYDFKCEKCDYIEEVLISSAESFKINLTCPECEKKTMKKQPCLSSFHPDGQGWGKDGYTKQSIMNARNGYTKTRQLVHTTLPKELQ